ncbi:MAG: hypothetical protein ACU0AU_06810 [Cognatishimia activa]
MRSLAIIATYLIPTFSFAELSIAGRCDALLCGNWEVGHNEVEFLLEKSGFGADGGMYFVSVVRVFGTNGGLN